MKFVFLGTPEFGAIILEGLVNSGYNPDLVITAPDKPVGRKQVITPPPVKITAEKYGLRVFQSDSLDSLKREIEKLSPDLMITAAYGKILSKEILELPKFGCLNVHPSLLPKYRGASPVQAAILNGDEETGVTIFLMDERIDRGKIVSSAKYPASNVAVYEELMNGLAKLGVKLLADTIPKWIAGEINAISQDESKASYAKTVKKEDGKIDWQKSAQIIERQVRAFHQWPGSYSFWESGNRKKRIKIKKAGIADFSVDETYRNGETFLCPRGRICVKCGEDVLTVLELQLEGKNQMSYKEFLKGHSDFIGAILK